MQWHIKTKNNEKLKVHAVAITWEGKEKREYFTQTLVDAYLQLYQRAYRFHLSEYPEQELLRENWFHKLEDSRILEITENYISMKDTSDFYFENRFLRRK